MATKQFDLFDKSTGSINTNSVGYSQLITTLTAVGRKVSHQKFYHIPFADYVPTVVGNGAFQRQIINWRTFSKSEGFESGVMSNSGNSARLSITDAAYDQLPQTIYSWARAIEYNLFELQEAMQANTLFSLIEAREKARRTEWDLGIQKIAFLGYQASKGLLNQSSVTVNSTTITNKISLMSAAAFTTFVGSIYETYRLNSNRTSIPTHFVMPESDFNGLITYPDSTYPLKTKIELLEAAFKVVTGNAGFKILPCAYCDKENFDGTNNRYAMYNYMEDSVKIDLPLDYTATAHGSSNGFTWSNAAYGQFSGVVALRDKEMLYFTNAV